jgi:hypothetical protein
MKAESAASVCYKMKDAALKAGDALMERTGRFEACQMLLDELLSAWLGSGSGDTAVWADGLAMPVMVRRNKNGYALDDFVKGTEDYCGPCFAVSSLGGAGTFERGLFDVCVSIAFLDDRQLMAAVVYDPVHVELFHAVSGFGAYRNGKSIVPAQTQDLSDALVSLDHATLRRGDDKTMELLSVAGHVRVASACGLELCYVACGRTDAAIRRNEAFFDYAAGLLVAKEAGAVAMDGAGASFAALKEYGERRDVAVIAPGLVGKFAENLA